MGTETGSGLWNPATVLLSSDGQWRLSAAAMAQNTDVPLSAQLGSVAGVWRHTTLALTVARAGVSGLLRTDSDPLGVGGDIPYSTLVLSAIAARRLTPHIIVGVAIRSRNGRLDDVSRTGVATDAGVLAEHLTALDVRVGASTFLFSPWSRSAERTSLLIGTDARLFGSDSSRTVRAGYAFQQTQALSTEHYLFAMARWGPWEVRGGPVQTQIYGDSNWRSRLGIAVHHDGYAVAVSREASVNGLLPTYHFSLSAVVR
ncbi:MAG: hypothetical protein ACHQQ3_07515 [Gemmatimonadales bacterium]